MKKRITAAFAITAVCVCLVAALPVRAGNSHFIPADSAKLEGRWDINMEMKGKIYPSWLEVELSGIKTLVGKYVGTGGSARPISEIHFDGSKLHFSIPPQWERSDKDVEFNAVLQGDTLSGTVLAADGSTYNWTGHRAPPLRRKTAVVWGKPIVLFNGKDLKGWHAEGAANQWVVENGILRSPHSGANLVSDQTFTDFKLHIEFRYPKESNSGVYLRGRYEVQVEDDMGKAPTSHLFSGVYGFLTPSDMMAKAAGEWQSYDITLTGRMVTVMANGKMVICNQEIPGITGGALNSREGEPGPLMMQGDHGPVDYRNIVITPGK